MPCSVHSQTFPQSNISNSQTFPQCHVVPRSFLHHLGLTEILAVILLYHPTSRHGDILSNESLGDFVTVGTLPSLLTGTEMVWTTADRGYGHRCHREANPRQKGHSATCALPFRFQRIFPVASVHHTVAIIENSACHTWAEWVCNPYIFNFLRQRLTL